MRHKPIPMRALVLSLAALAVPAVTTLWLHGETYDHEMLLWLLALVPAFLLAYYRGWQGVATALAAGMAVLVSVHVTALWLGLEIQSWPLLFEVVTSYIGISLGLGFLSERLHGERRRAQQLALTDDLTRLPNRRAARFFLEKEFAAARRGRPLTVVLFDLDGFKRYNDRHGHVSGDEALRVFGTVLGSNTRRMNLSARYGGEEFVSVVSGEPLEGVTVFTERVLEGLKNAQPEGLPLTVSAGIATYRGEMASEDELLEAADQALYRAKEAGGDCLEIFEAAAN